MQHTDRRRASAWRASIGRTAAAVLAVGGLSGAVLAAGVATAATSPSTASVISTAKNSKLGTILTSDTTVYIMKTSKAACDDQCAKTWSPVLLPQGVTTATAGNGVDASKLGTTALAGGALQITYSGNPLYWNSKDKAPGQVHGNASDKWGKWATVVTAKAKSGSNDKNDPNAGTGGNAF